MNGDWEGATTLNRLWQWQNDGPITLQIARPLLTRLWSWARKSLEAELGAFLIGTVRTNEEGLFRIIVKDFVPAENTRSNRGEFTFKAEALTRNQHDFPIPAGELPNGLTCVGWVHTHSGSGVYFSETDLETHQQHFNLPFQLAMVVDPRSQLAGIYYWERPGQLGPDAPDAREARFDPATGLNDSIKPPHRFSRPEPLAWVFGLSGALAILGVLLFGWGASLRQQSMATQTARLLSPNDENAFRWVLAAPSTSWLYALTPAGAEAPDLSRTMGAQLVGNDTVMIQLTYADIEASHLTGPLWLWVQSNQESTPQHLNVPELVDTLPQTGIVIPLGNRRFALREPSKTRVADRLLQLVNQGEQP